jgi:hypothetical protein
MQAKKQIDVAESIAVDDSRDDGQLRSLIENRSVATRDLQPPGAGVVIGELVAMIDDGRTPLVRAPGQAPVRARATVDVHGAHVGRQIALMFENGDPGLPLIIGILRKEAENPLQESSGAVEVEADDQRLVVSASQRLVLRCGKARITLTRAGKVIIEGTYISSRSSGVNRLKGGSVHLN